MPSSRSANGSAGAAVTGAGADGAASTASGAGRGPGRGDGRRGLVGQGQHRLVGQQALDAGDGLGDVDVPLAAGRLDGAQQVTDAVDDGQQHVGRRAVHRAPAVAQLRQEVLAGVRQAFQTIEREEAARALDRVDRAEHAAQQPAVARRALERDEVAVELVEVLVTLDEELADDVVDVLHAGPPGAATPRGSSPGLSAGPAAP